MEKSLESIWNNGFIKNEELIVPKIHDLYNRKSNLLIEKLKRTYRTDNRSLIPLALSFGLGLGFTGHLMLGFYVMLLILTLFFLNRRKLADLEKITVTTSSYEYLMEYRKTIDDLKKFYTRLLGFGMPIAGMIGYYLYFRKTEVFQDFLLLKSWYIILIISGIALVLSGIGILAYRFSMGMFYNKLLKRLDELISDMGELRK